MKKKGGDNNNNNETRKFLKELEIFITIKYFVSFHYYLKF